MSSWEALAWAKKQKLGNSLRKLIFLLMCEKCGEEFQYYQLSSKLADEAECSGRAISEHQKALQEAGLITIVEQLRPNGSQAWSVIYINHPKAPHVLGLAPLEARPGFRIKPAELVTRGKRKPGAKKPKQAPPVPEKGSTSGVRQLQGGGCSSFRARGAAASGGGGAAASGYGGEAAAPLDLSPYRSLHLSEGKTDGNSSPTEEKPNPKNAPSGEALSLIADELEWGRHKRPTKQQAHELAALVDAALSDGLTMVEIRRHCVASLNEAKRAGVSYLRGALSDKHLPMPRRQADPAKAPQIATEAPAAPAAPEVRSSAMAAMRAAISEAKAKNKNGSDKNALPKRTHHAPMPATADDDDPAAIAAIIAASPLAQAV